MATPTIGLALGGGGARGFAHVHALQAFDDLGIEPCIIAGTSIGAIIGAGYASGLSGDEVYDFTLQRFRNRFKLIADLFRIKPENAREFLKAGGPRFGEINIERVLSLLLPPDFAMGFGELRIPLKVVATNFHSQGDAVFEKGPLLPALAASSAIPALFRPVIVEGEVYIDGGITNPTPFDTLADEVDIVVAIDVSGFPAGPRGRRPRKVDVLLASSHIMQQSIIRAKALRFQPDILIRPNVEGFRIHDFVKIERILEASQPLREKLKSDLSSAIRKWSVACSS